MARHSTLKASDADREQVIDRLRRAASEGRILAEELEHRVAAALKARTYGELDATLVDLPGPGRQPSGRYRPALSMGRWMFSLLRANPLLGLLLLPLFALTLAMVFAVLVISLVLMVAALVLSGRPRYAAWSCVRQRAPRSWV